MQLWKARHAAAYSTHDYWERGAPMNGCSSDRPTRRRFLARCTLPLLLPSLGVPTRIDATRQMELRIPDAYYLWYNAPNVVSLGDGFCIGYLTSTGEVTVAEISEDLRLVRSTVLYRYADASDHGSPTLARITTGRHAGHLLACFSKHATALMCATSRRPGRIDEWEAPRAIDAGRCTYPSLNVLPDGGVALTYTRQNSVPQMGDLGEWRECVCAISNDGGETWEAPQVLASHGPGTFPYAAPMAVSTTGSCAVAYSLYSTIRKRHEGLRIVVSSDRFFTVSNIPLPACWSEGEVDVIPYQARWVSDRRLWAIFALRKRGEAECEVMLAIVSFDRRGVAKSRVHSVALARVEGYTGGAALARSRDSLVLQGPGGELLEQRIAAGCSRVVRGAGRYASPLLFDHSDGEYLMFLDNPMMRSTSDYRSDLLVLRLR